MIIFLTGVTGHLGGELLTSLASNQKVKKIYCLVRAQNSKDAFERIENVFRLRGDQFDLSKIIAVHGDLLDPGLSENLSRNGIIQDINIVIHSAANTSFASINNKLIEAINIEGLKQILQFSKSLKFLETFVYVGTASICGNKIMNKTIFEDEFPSENSSHFVHYTRTKSDGELLVKNELPHEKVLIVRPSIIMGTNSFSTPRSPVILWALATINSLRLCAVNENSKLDIIPADWASESIIRLLQCPRKNNVYHISSGLKSSTTLNKLTSAIAPFFIDLPPFHFVEKSKFNEFKNWAKGENYNQQAVSEYQNYFDYWLLKFRKKQNLRVIFAGLEPYLEFIELSQVFDNNRLISETGIENSVPADEYILKNIDYLKSIKILEGAQDA